MKIWVVVRSIHHHNTQQVGEVIGRVRGADRPILFRPMSRPLMT